MKALTPKEMYGLRSTKRVPKPMMEKRRRERINQSLETLRLLMLDNTHNEKLKNPKVEKAEILESVVKFLETGKEEDEKSPRSTSGGQRPDVARQHSFHDGMRSCLLRVSHFIANKSKELDGTEEHPAPASLALPEPQTYPPTSPGHTAQGAVSPQHHEAHNHQHHHCQSGISHHPHLTQRDGLHGDTRELLSSTAACTHVTDPVWRPWPQ
ncbi:hairy-related 5 [Pseudoliparis swirei]|uniref:hairy-related 5 n=1 Tax=Pseudoliparis swirei TaxID=2059687 RepID=UPI0024BE85BE|nr:hairy-related 5 [Pseudoliparis swirei]